MDRIGLIEHKITDFAGFEDTHVITFNPNKSTVILGINGAGKTSLLNSIYYCLIKMLSIVLNDRDLTKEISNSMIFYGKSEATVLANFSTSYLYKKSEFEIGFYLDSANTLFDQGAGNGEIKQQINSSFINSEEPLPIVRYFRSRKVDDNQSSIILRREFNQIMTRNVGYQKINHVGVAIQDIVGFLIDQINIENNEKIKKKKWNYETKIGKYLRRTLQKFTAILYGEKIEISVDASKYSNGQSLIIKKGTKEIEFHQLSSGEKYLIGMVLELIYRNITLNKDVEDYINVPGIVLIDEIDSHLHPRWQLTILEALEEVFPNIQFIVSTHSPLIASSVHKEDLIALSNFNFLDKDSIPDLYSGSANELLENILFADSRINDFKEEQKEIELLINGLQYEEAESKFNILKEKVGSSPKWLLDLDRKIQFVKA